jgi:CheY-like chemotaxis protein
MGDLRGLRVLVVEDDDDNRELLEVALRRRGAEVRVAGGALDALAILERFAPHVLVSDLKMPTMDGLSFMRAVRSTPRGDAIQSIALTALAAAGDQQAAIAAGFDRIVTKPAGLRELVAAVSELAARPRALEGG